MTAAKVARGDNQEARKDINVRNALTYRPMRVHLAQGDRSCKIRTVSGSNGKVSALGSGCLDELRGRIGIGGKEEANHMYLN